MNSKEALENIRDYHNETVIDNYCTYTENIFEKELDIIEKDLKVLEIIKNHILNIDMNTSGVYLKFHNGHYEPYYTIEIKDGINKIVSIEEYTKLKEWMEK